MKQVIAPDNTVWRIRRRWLPRTTSRARAWMEQRRNRRRHSELSGDDVAHVAVEGLGCLDEAFWAVLVVAVVAALFFLGIPLLLAIVDVLVVAALTIVGVVARVLFRRPWTVEAVSRDHLVERHVIGWRRASEVVDQLAIEARNGTLA